MRIPMFSALFRQAISIASPAASRASLLGSSRAFSATRTVLKTNDLEGIMVVSIDQAVAAPYCATRLADMGARVIKVERPEGDFARRYDKLVQDQSACGWKTEACRASSTY
jgi:hypothetical protein